MSGHPACPADRGREQDPMGKLRRFEPVCDALVLAAIDRAERHSGRRGDGASMNEIAEHLGFLRGSWTTRGLRPQLDALIQAGALVRSSRHGIVVWMLTGAGRRRAARELRAGKTVLPEAPQHRLWRHTRGKAAERIDFFGERVRRTLDDATGLLDAEQPGSDAWFCLAERLLQTCRQLGSATYCLYEWAEPRDAHTDIDDHRAPGDEQLDRERRSRREEARRHRRETRDWEAPR